MKKAKVSKYGQWKYPGEDTIIPNANGSITMKGVPYPVLGIDDRGNRKLMMPGGEYQFPGNSVYEIPMMAAGGIVNPCPPGKVPDGKGNCVDDLTTPPIPSSSLYPYYTEQLAKIKANPSFTDPDALIGQMIKAKRSGSCQSGECWEEEPEPVKVQVQSGPKQHYTIKESGNPGHSYLWKYTDDGKGGYMQELQGSVFTRDFLNDEQQVQYDAPTGGSWVVDYDPNVHKVYLDQRDVTQTIEGERGWEQRTQNNLNREQQKIEQEKAYREQWEKEQKEKQKKRIADANGQYAYGGGIDPDKPKIDFTNKTKSSDENYITKQIFYDNNTAKNKNRRTLKGFITGAPKPGEPGGPPKFAMGGTKMIKIKSLPKAQDLGELTPEQRKVYDDRYIYNREYGFDPNDSHKTALRDAQLSGNPDPIYNPQTFLPEAKVIIPAGKRFPKEHINWDGYSSWQENYMSDPDYVRRYNKMTPDQQVEAKRQIDETQNAESYYKSVDAVKAWERDWYTKRAELPWFTDIANKRLNLTRDINMQPYGNDEEYKIRFPGSGGVFTTDGNYVGLPPYAWSDKNAMVHERSHWLDFNAPQNDDMYNGSYLRSLVIPSRVPLPVYNDEDDALYDIIPAEYKFPSGVVDPLRLGENDTNTYNSETEKIEANMPKSSDDIRANTVKIPFKGKASVAGHNNIEYYHNPTEVRARLNEWRFQHNIDPTKYYSNEELQQIIDQDIENNQPGSFDLYKVIQGRGDLLKKLHDTYVSTGDKENPDEMPKAKRGLRKAQDGLPTDYESFLKYSETAPENRRPDSEWQYGNPRQYDHYGMWDALGKPKNFDEALQKNPQWQPDPYDNMYHGFSTNPNTGVWLKSHIPGESHPGDTGWMEYKDFMLSNDRNWGGKNQNLVYDPDLQRMRYVDRKKAGGALTKAQTLGNYITRAQPQTRNWEQQIMQGIPAAPPKAKSKPTTSSSSLKADLKKMNQDLISGSAVAESTMPANMFKPPLEWEGLSGPQVLDLLKAQKLEAERQAELASRDVLTADTKSDSEKLARKAWTAISHPMETLSAVARGYSIPYGYMGMHNPYDEMGLANPMNWSTDLLLGGPGFIANAITRQGEQIVDNPGEYLLGQTLGLFDPKYRDQALSNYLDLSAIVPASRVVAGPIANAARPIVNAARPVVRTLGEIGTATRGLSPSVSSNFFNKNYSPLFKFSNKYGYIPDYSVGKTPANFEFAQPSIYRNINPSDLELSKNLGYVVSPYESRTGLDVALNNANSKYLTNYYFGRGTTPQGIGGRLPGTAGTIDGYHPFFMEGTKLFDTGLNPRPLLRFNQAKAPNININESFLGAENYNFQPKTHTQYRIAVPDKRTRQISNYDILKWDPELNTYVPNYKKGGTIKQVKIKSLPKAQITGELSKEKQEALDREFRRQQATAWDPNGLNGAQEVPTDNVVIKPMIIGLPPKNAPKKSKEEKANDAAKKTNKKAQNDATLWLLEHPEYMIGPTGTPVLKSSMESQAPAEYLTLEQKALKDEFIRERNADPLQQSLGALTDENPQTASAAERYANTELAAPLLEKNPRDKYATRAEWIESFNPQERAIIQGSNKSYKFNPNVWTTFSRALQTEGNRDTQWQQNLDLTQEEKNAPVTKMDRLGLLAPLAIPAYGAQRLLTGDYENLSDLNSGDTPKPYFGDSGTMRDYYQPQAQAIGNGLWQAALDPLNYIAGEGIGLGMLDDLRFGKFMDNAIAKSVNEFSALTPNLHAFDPKVQALRNMRGYGTGIGNGVLPGHDDIFRYLAEAERTSGVDRSYLMGLSDDSFLRHSVVGADVRDPSYHVSDDLLGRWQLEDARINNRVPLAPPPSEISIPFNVNDIVTTTSRPSVLNRLFGSINDRVRAIRRVAGDDVPISQVRSNFRNYVASDPGGPMNKSLLGKTETKALLKDKSEIDKLEKLSDSEFRDILITPDGRIKFPEKYTGPKQITKVETKDWVEEFNGNLDLLNRIIAENNTSGREYWVTGITEDGLLKFRTADGRTSTMRTDITPGKFKGEVQDIADETYMVKEIPGIQMSGASPIFGNAVRGTGTYKSLNEYLKKMELGRVKSGMNVQSEFSKPLWENAIKKGDAFGFYASPGTVYGIMKKEGGTKKNKPGFQVLTDANGKYVFVKT